MNYKKYVELVTGMIFLGTAIYHITIDKPEIYIPAVIFGVMFFLQGLNKLRHK